MPTEANDERVALHCTVPGLVEKVIQLIRSETDVDKRKLLDRYPELLTDEADNVLEQVETGVWHPKMTRREFELGANVTGIGPDDPDANFFENYKCGSSRNYTDYCNAEVDRLIEEQSQMVDPARRLALVHEIDKRLQLEGARPIMGWRILYFQHWPYVKNLVAHQSIYNFGRMQEVWLDR